MVLDDRVTPEEPALLPEHTQRVQPAEARIARNYTVSTSAWERAGQLRQAVKALGQEVETKPK